MDRVLLSALVLAAVLSAAPHSGLEAAPTSPPGAKVEGNLYTNMRLGFAFRFPQGWSVAKFDELGATEGIILKVTPPNSDNPMLFVYYQDLKGAFLIQSEANHLGIHEMSMKEAGFEVTRPTRPVSYNNRQFYRLDFRSRQKKDRTYQSTVVVILDRDAPNRKLIGFGAAGVSEKEVEDVLSSLATFQLSEDKDNTAPNSPPLRVRISQIVSEANLIEKVNPRYPEEAKMGRIQGVVVLKVVIGREGWFKRWRSYPAILCLCPQHGTPFGDGVTARTCSVVSRLRWKPESRLTLLFQVTIDFTLRVSVVPFHPPRNKALNSPVFSPRTRPRKPPLSC